MYLDLLGDSENEVKLTAVKGIACLASCSSAGPFVDVLGAKLSALACDPQQQARSAFSEFVLDMCPSFGKELSVKILLPIILKFLDDDVSDMRVNVLEKLDMLVECVGVKDVVDAILPRVLSMSKDSKWRVRKSVVENISQLAESIVLRFLCLPQNFDRDLPSLTKRSNLYCLKHSKTKSMLSEKLLQSKCLC